MLTITLPSRCYLRSSSCKVFTFISIVLLLGVKQGQTEQMDCLHPQMPSDCIIGETFFDILTGCCKACSTCMNNVDQGIMIMRELECDLTHDTVCRCNPPLVFNSSIGTCTLQCSLCPREICEAGNPSKCSCPISECYTPDDKFCRNPISCPGTVLT